MAAVVTVMGGGQSVWKGRGGTIVERVASGGGDVVISAIGNKIIMMIVALLLFCVCVARACLLLCTIYCTMLFYDDVLCGCVFVGCFLG